MYGALGCTYWVCPGVFALSQIAKSQPSSAVVSAAETYRELTASGMTELDAHFTVSRLLGHERADVTNIYLASIKKDGGESPA